ncbi:hypothetical protein JTE90_003263 [Oedothorax gibbosus]|uniref:Uncharacterized protein n=1 Tax=Oedothorax gibbosus TaxID=931172 RepID=A0AAV6V6F5_9ARAC|nr:hypothetical protein JTE90_003263 [Oedothorax gibbosus]
MAKKKNSKSKFAEAIDPRFTGVVQTLKNEAKISNIPKKFFKREVNSDGNEAFQNYLRKRWYDYMESNVEYVVLPPEQQRNKWEFPEIEEVELLNGILIPLSIEEKPESPPDVPIFPQKSVIEENNGQDAPPKKKRKKKTESSGVSIIPQNSVIKENDGQDAPPKKKGKNKLESSPDVPILSQNSDIEENNRHTPPKKKKKKEKVCKNKMTFDSDEAFQEHLRKRWYDYMESKVEYVVLPPEQQRNKWEFPEIKEVELLPGIPIIPNKEEKDGQEAPPKKKRKKEKKKEKECFKEVAVTAEWLEKQAKLYIS